MQRLTSDFVELLLVYLLPSPRIHDPEADWDWTSLTTSCKFHTGHAREAPCGRNARVAI